MTQQQQQPELIRDEDFTYTWFGHAPTTRRLRVYRTEPGHVTAILTERGPGTSITNAAALIRSRLAAEYPDDIVTQVEHYPLDAHCGQEHFDVYDPHRIEQPWYRLPLEATAALYGITLGLRG